MLLNKETFNFFYTNSKTVWIVYDLHFSDINFSLPVSNIPCRVIGVDTWLSKRMTYHISEACFETSAQKIMYARLAINTSSPDVSVKEF